MEEIREKSDVSEDGVVKRFPDAERALWTQFAEAATVEGFCRSWLALQCRMIEGTAGALVLLGKPEEGPYTPVAVWPDAKKNMEYLTPAAEKALAERQGVFFVPDELRGSDSVEDRGFHVAYPIEISGRLYGVVVLDVRAPSDAHRQQVLRMLHWGMAWLEVLFRRREGSRESETLRRLISILDLLSVALEQDRFQGAASAFVTETAGRLGCERVSLGFLRKRHIRVSHLSHSADFGKKMGLVHAMAAAMEEAVDQGSVIVYPQPEEQEPRVTRAHEELAEKMGGGSVCTVPLMASGKPVGALTLERDSRSPFDSDEVQLCEGLGALVGPILVEKRKNDRWLIQKTWDSFKNSLGKLLGPGHLGLKLSALVLAGAVVFFSLAQGDYRVTASATLEGEVQRSVVAPFDGYVAEEGARAGDLVSKGDLLAALDERDLRLERIKWASEKEQLLKEHREALALRDRAKIRIIRARIDQAEAQLALLDEQLSRMRIVSPFDGIVVSGDLTQSLGAPVERGQVLFEIAPLDRYRVVLRVDEREITRVVPGQEGTLVLSSMPNRKIGFVVKKITPVSEAREGRNFFRVEAALKETSGRLRPGMEGVGKIFVERRKLIWVWTHDLIDWFKLWVWSWRP
ncbi:MAG: efflux RND transporter periplasmic adaptor subunit [Deltaproteobacteria bacterium]|nr:efflux RND transporter periplasmic adaptor subunit [Deltaproteobacteria bacterium]RLB34704.1 MAG: hypothetical protein DRH20_11845 [Deltaproteobacteria bacterium]